MKITVEKTNKRKKNIETSKLIILSVVILTYLFSFFVCFMVYKTEDLSPFSYLIPSIFGLSTTAIGFYSWKAKAENKLKIEIQRIQEEQKLKKKYKDEEIKIDYKDRENVVENNGIYNNYEEGGLG